MSSEVARRKHPEVAVYECCEREGKHCAPRFPFAQSVTSLFLE